MDITKHPFFGDLEQPINIPIHLPIKCPKKNKKNNKISDKAPTLTIFFSIIKIY